MNAPEWSDEAERQGLINAEWTWDDTNEEWWTECHDARHDGSHERWTVSAHDVELECGDFTARVSCSDSPVPVMAALAACIDAFNVEHNKRSNA